MLESRIVQGLTPEPSLYDRASDYQGSRRNSVTPIQAIEDDSKYVFQPSTFQLCSMLRRSQSPSDPQPFNTPQTPSHGGSRIDALGSPRPSFSYPAPSSGVLAGPSAHIPQGEPTLRLTSSTSFETPRRLQHPHESYPTPDSNDRPRIRREGAEHFEDDNMGQVVSDFFEQFRFSSNILATRLMLIAQYYSPCKLIASSLKTCLIPRLVIGYETCGMRTPPCVKPTSITAHRSMSEMPG